MPSLVGSEMCIRDSFYGNGPDMYGGLQRSVDRASETDGNELHSHETSEIPNREDTRRTCRRSEATLRGIRKRPSGPCKTIHPAYFSLNRGLAPPGWDPPDSPEASRLTPFGEPLAGIKNYGECICTLPCLPGPAWLLLLLSRLPGSAWLSLLLSLFV